MLYLKKDIQNCHIFQQRPFKKVVLSQHLIPSVTTWYNATSVQQSYQPLPLPPPVVLLNGWQGGGTMMNDSNPIHHVARHIPHFFFPSVNFDPPPVGSILLLISTPGMISTTAKSAKNRSQLGGWNGRCCQRIAAHKNSSFKLKLTAKPNVPGRKLPWFSFRWFFVPAFGDWMFVTTSFRFGCVRTINVGFPVENLRWKLRRSAPDGSLQVPPSSPPFGLTMHLMVGVVLL